MDFNLYYLSLEKFGDSFKLDKNKNNLWLNWILIIRNL
jgi:hypothetical protein